jgi:hypothetical protein
MKSLRKRNGIPQLSLGMTADVRGKLPSTAGWQPALPGVPRSMVFPSPFLPHDLHFSL